MITYSKSLAFFCILSCLSVLGCRHSGSTGSDESTTSASRDKCTYTCRNTCSYSYKSPTNPNYSWSFSWAPGYWDEKTEYEWSEKKENISIPTFDAVPSYEDRCRCVCGVAKWEKVQNGYRIVQSGTETHTITYNELIKKKKKVFVPGDYTIIKYLNGKPANRSVWHIDKQGLVVSVFVKQANGSVKETRVDFRQNDRVDETPTEVMEDVFKRVDQGLTFAEFFNAVNSNGILPHEVEVGLQDD